MDVIENKVSRVLKLCSGKSAASYITAHEQPQFKPNLSCLVYLLYLLLQFNPFC